jgi:3'-5' exonuclease
MRHVAVIDLETVPDPLWVPPADNLAAFPPPAFHKVVAIGMLVASRADDGAYAVVDARAGGRPETGERDLIRGFDRKLREVGECGAPQVVTYNGRAFDLPVMKARAMVHGVPLPSLHPPARGRHGGYFARYSDLHFDLYDQLADRGAAKPGGLAGLCLANKIPGKLGGVDGSAVAAMMDAGQLDAVRAYVVHDVLSAYLLYLRLQAMRCEITMRAFESSIDDLAAFVDERRATEPHLGVWLDAWSEASRRDAEAEVPSVAGAAA